MEIFYTAYTKTINGTPFYFVKSYRKFPEFKNVPPVLETYGMHADFKKACKIAMIFDDGICQQLMITVENNYSSTKVIPLLVPTAKMYNIKKRHIVFPSLLKKIGLG